MSEAHLLQTKLMQKMSAQEKLKIMSQLREMAWELKTAGIKAQHPEWTPSQVEEKVREIFLYART